jgi:hypothetical protein
VNVLAVSINKLSIKLFVLGLSVVAVAAVVAAAAVPSSSGKVALSEDFDGVAALFVSRLLVVSDTSRSKTLENSSTAGSCVLFSPELLIIIDLSVEVLI